MQLITHPKQVGASLQARRKTLGLTQAEVAERLGLSQNRLSELETRPETFTLEQLLAVLNVLGLDLALGERKGTGSRVEW
jgi:HTH-type transcriptional regulator/antitoxin HipB